MNATSWYHVTTLSNFAQGYDKYQRCYSKAAIAQSRFPAQFFLLRHDELAIGIAKAQRLLEKLNLAGNRLLVLATQLADIPLFNDHASGVGHYIKQNFIPISRVYYLAEAAQLIPMRIEDVVAESFAVLHPTLLSWQQLKPRTISILPIAHACQASCRFCFSKASVSSNFSGQFNDWAHYQQVLQHAKQAGAERVVITGGGEPSLLKHTQLITLVQHAAEHFDKIVLISNVHRFANMADAERLASLSALQQAGLSVLAMSRHHADSAKNAHIMGLDPQTERVCHSLQQLPSRSLQARLVCVLQRHGVANVDDIAEYLNWAVQHGVSQVNFKELYVASRAESIYSSMEANEYSAQYQVPLRMVYDFVAQYGWQQIAQLPWGAPIFAGNWQGQTMQIAAYTEPSVYWERTHGLARSWNLMSDGKLLASLEDPNSEICL